MKAAEAARLATPAVGQDVLDLVPGGARANTDYAMLRTGGCWPARPLLRSLGRYDTTAVRSQHSYSQARPHRDAWRHGETDGQVISYPLPRRYAPDQGTCAENGQSCTKNKNATQGLMPGLLVSHCPKCGSCLGFQIMKDAESPKSVFDVLVTRW